MLSCFSHVQLFVILWTIAHHAPLSMGFSKLEYWSGLPCLLPGDLPNPRMEPMSPAAPALQADSLLLSHQEAPTYHMCMHAKLLQSCPTLCDPIDCSPPGSSVRRILQARILEWVVMPSSRGSSRPRDRTYVSYMSCIGWQVLYY